MKRVPPDWQIERIKWRKRITAALARAVERHRRVREAANHADRLMPWENWKCLMAWQDEWELYLRKEREKLYDGNKYERRSRVRDLNRRKREAHAVRTDAATGA